LVQVAEQAIDPSGLHPYCTFLVLEYAGGAVERAIPSMLDLLKEGLRPRGSRSSTLLASGFDDPQRTLAVVADDDAEDGLDGFVFSDVDKPSWASESGYTDVEHHLVVVYARGRLLAVYAPARLRKMVARRIRKGSNRPPFRLVAPRLLREAFLAGEAKGLWLRGVHPTSPTKPDAKNLSGQRLQDALDMFDDSTFTLGAGRAVLPDDPSRVALRGTVGTTPGEGVVWNGPSDDFTGFVQTALEVLDFVHEMSISADTPSVLFPQLATELDSLQGVEGAYEIVVSDPDFLPPETSDEARDAALVLQGAIIDVDGDASGPNFTLSIGRNGAEAGRLRARVKVDDGLVDIDVGYKDAPSHPDLVSPVLKALAYPEVYSVYYASGQVISGGTLTTRQTQHLPFRDWSFEDFEGFDITREKPAGRTAAEIHAAIGKDGDTSLFSWVVRHYSQGWLTCDDGPGEVADFVHLAGDGTISLVHVKGADSDSPSRTVKVTDYELVTSQASKNLHFVRHPHALPDRLGASAIASPATWKDGQPVDSRDEMIERLRCRSARALTRVVIVQPHQQRTVIEKVRVTEDAGKTGANVLRLQLLETLLTSARASAIKVGLEFEVIADSR
jgi:hypothetical protein